MRPLNRVFLGTMIGLFAMSGCDCESMLSTKRKSGAPTSSAGPAVEPARALPERRTPPSTISRPPPKRTADPKTDAPEETVDAPPQPPSRPSRGRIRPTPSIRPGFDRRKPIRPIRNMLPGRVVDDLNDTADEPESGG